jgi:hypothetical protein
MMSCMHGSSLAWKNIAVGKKTYWFKTRLQQGSTVCLFFYMTYIYTYTYTVYIHIYWHQANSCNSEPI